MLREDLKNITIDNLLDDNKISTRSGHCCFNAQFQSLADIIEYYENGNSFLNIRNAGRRTCLDLETLCKEYILKLNKPVQVIDEISEEERQQEREYHIRNLIENDFLNAIETKQIDAKDILNYLSINQKIIIEDKFRQYETFYSNRTINRIRTIGFENFVTDYLFSSDNELYKINGLGSKSIKEVIDLKSKMKKEFLQLINLQEEDIAKINLIREKGKIMLNDFVAEFYKANNHLPMFWILEQQLITSKSRRIDIFTNTFPVFQNYHLKTLDEIACRYNITRERVRQIRNETFHNTFEITDELDGFKEKDEFVPIKQILQRKDDWIYLLEALQEVIFIKKDSVEIQEYLKKEQCSFSIVFALQIIAYVFRDKYMIYGGLNISNQKSRHTFLIYKKFADIFNFEKFIEEFANHIADNEMEYNLNIDVFLSNNACWTSVIDLNKFDYIVSITKSILLYEFHLYPNIDGLITIPITKEKSPLDVVYNILKIKGEPMHLDDIFNEFKNILPKHKYSQENNPDRLRPYLQKHESISYRNRSSIYTLKEWEHIRTGTIRDAIVDFLTDNNLPQSADDITEYVLLHFPETNIASVRTSMFNDTQRRFSFFGNGLFGLVSKEYPTEYEKIEQQEGQRKSFEKRLYDFEKFLTENNHFPFSTSDNEEEPSLYRWWRIQNKSTAKLTTQQKANIERIKLQYADLETDKTVYEWFYHFNDFKLFVLENCRLPSANGSEKFLYGWFRRAKDDFLNDRLSEKQRTKYAELFKELRYVER